jgi:hypothetical protein
VATIAIISFWFQIFVTSRKKKMLLTDDPMSTWATLIIQETKIFIYEKQRQGYLERATVTISKG